MFARKKFSGYVGFINNPYRIHVYVALWMPVCIVRLYYAVYMYLNFKAAFG